MVWDKMDRNLHPDYELISNFVRNSIWEELYEYITKTYHVKPTYEYSRCAWPGWNVKFKRAGKNLCTIYPFEGYLWVLVVIGKKEKETFETELNTMRQYMQTLYSETEEGMGQRWLKIEAEDISILNDVRKCLAIKSGQKNSKE